MELTVLFPHIMGNILPPWDIEIKIAKEENIHVVLFEEDTLAINEDLSNQIVIYRGWMLSEESYAKLSKNVEKRNGKMLIPLSQYKKANSFSNWYNLLSRYTMKSYFIQDFTKLDELFKNETKFFIKDNLKSLGSKNSIATTKEEAIDIYSKIIKNRDFEIKNNGICLREVTELSEEERFFIFNLSQ